MRKREDSSIEIHDSEVHSGARRVYNGIEELMNWMGNYGPDYLGFSHIAVMDDVLPKDYDETQPTDRKMEEDGNARDKLTQIRYFSENQKRRCHCDERCVTNGQPIAGSTRFGMFEAANT